MTWLYPAWTPERSLRRGFAVWDLYYSQWGNVNAGTGNGFFPDPAYDGAVKLTNYHGIAIGARSTVDRVFIRTQLVYDLQQNTILKPLPTWVDGQSILDYQACHVGQPLRGQVLGPVTIQTADMYDATTEYVPDDGTYTPTLLVTAEFEHPVLHLQLLQRNQDVSLLNGPRMPMFRELAVGATLIGSEALLKIYPIAGRRGVTFQGRATVGAVDFRIGVIGASPSIGGGLGPLIEQTLANVTAVGPATPPAYIDLSGRAQYLAIYATVTDDALGVGAEFYFSASITDDCCGEATVEAGGDLVLETSANILEITGTAGEDLAAGAPVVFGDFAALGVVRLYNADANGADRRLVVGFNKNVAIAGAAVLVRVAGDVLVPDAVWDVVPVLADLGKRVFLSENIGKVTLTAPTTAASSVLKLGLVSQFGAGTSKVAIQIGDAVTLVA